MFLELLSVDIWTHELPSDRMPKIEWKEFCHKLEKCNKSIILMLHFLPSLLLLHTTSDTLKEETV